MTFADFKAKYVGDVLGRTQLYQLLKIGRGELTQDKVRLLEREKKQQQRAAQSSGTSSSSRTQTEPEPEAQAQAGIEPDKARAAAEERKEKLAAGWTESIDSKGNVTWTEPYVEPEDERIDRELAEWKRDTAAKFNGWPEDERKKGRTWFNSQRWDVVPLLRDGRKAA
jgi:hypothetical protein